MSEPLLKIQLLGGVTLGASGGEPIPVVGLPPAALLAYLATHTGLSHARDELTALLWPDEDQDTARQRFRQALYALRQQIAQVCGNDADILRATRSTVALIPDRIEIDVVMFESLLAKATRVSEHDRLMLLENAQDLYRGELAPGVYIEPILSERNRLSMAHLKALHLLVEVYEQVGQLEKAIATAHRVIAANPLLEEAYCDLMRLYAAAGQPSAVVQQYQELARILAAELDGSPSETTRSLMEALRRRGIDQVASRPRNGVGISVALTGDPDQSMGAGDMLPVPDTNDIDRALPALQPMASDLRHSVVVASPQMPLRRLLYVLVLVILLIAALGYTLETFTHRQKPHLAPPLIPSPQTLWERRIPLAPGDGDSEPTAITIDQTGAGVYITGFVQTAKQDTDFVTMRYDGNGRLLWQSRYNGPGNDVDRARAVAAGGTSDVFVTGESDNGRGNGASRLSGLDIATIKYDGNTGKQRWVARYNGAENGEDRACRVVADGQGGCVVAGCSWDGRNADRSARWAGILIAYDAQGHLRWNHRVRAPDDLECRFTDLRLVSGGVVALRSAYRRASIGSENASLLARYDWDGKLRWEREVRVCSGKEDNDSKLYVDGTGNSVVATESHNFRQSDNGVGSDYLVAKFDPEGNAKWLRTYDSPAHLDDTARGITVDGSGRVTVTGESLSAPNDLDIVTVQYDADGAQRWVQRFAGRGGSVDSPNDIVAWDDFVFLTGFTSSRHPNGTDLGTRDYVTLKYDASGAIVWRAIYDGPLHNIDFGVSLTVDMYGNAYVTGQSAGVHNSIVTLKYAP